jgi:hypothetical protein
MGKNSIYHSDREVWGKKQKRIKGNDTIHYPNQDETRALRRIMSQTGLSAEEVRSHRKYRKLLSEAAKEGLKPKRNSMEKFYQNLIKKACRDTGLVPQHPDTLVTLQSLIDDNFSRSWGWRTWMFGNHNPLKAETAVKHYAK